jgi:hypothetical protein
VVGWLSMTVKEALEQAERRAASRRRNWRRGMVVAMAFIVFAGLSNYLYDKLFPPPPIRLDRWTGEGEVQLVVPATLNGRIGDRPFHWRFLQYSSVSGDISIRLVLTRTPERLPKQANRTSWWLPGAQEPGGGDSAVISVHVMAIPFAKMAAAYSGEKWNWTLKSEGAKCVAYSRDMDETVSLGETDKGEWKELWSYHYWRPEDGPAPSLNPPDPDKSAAERQDSNVH